MKEGYKVFRQRNKFIIDLLLDSITTSNAPLNMNMKTVISYAARLGIILGGEISSWASIGCADP